MTKNTTGWKPNIGDIDAQDNLFAQRALSIVNEEEQEYSNSFMGSNAHHSILHNASV
jgi:hypothetical protein